MKKLSKKQILILAIVLAGMMMSVTACGSETTSTDDKMPTLEAEMADGSKTQETAPLEPVEDNESAAAAETDGQAADFGDVLTADIF